jgi:hypothetical protein
MTAYNTAYFLLSQSLNFLLARSSQQSLCIAENANWTPESILHFFILIVGLTFHPQDLEGQSH